MGKKKEITYPVIEQKLTGIRCEEKIPYRAKQKKKKTAISKILGNISNIKLNVFKWTKIILLKFL